MAIGAKQRQSDGGEIADALQISSDDFIVEGDLWKLAEDVEPDEEEADESWFKRRFRIIHTGAMGYWSEKEQRLLLLFNGDPLIHNKLTVRKASGPKFPHMIELVRAKDHLGNEWPSAWFAADTAKAQTAWVEILSHFCYSTRRPRKLDEHAAVISATSRGRSSVSLNGPSCFSSLAAKICGAAEPEVKSP